MSVPLKAKARGLAQCSTLDATPLTLLPLLRNGDMGQASPPVHNRKSWDLLSLDDEQALSAICFGFPPDNLLCQWADMKRLSTINSAAMVIEAYDLTKILQGDRLSFRYIRRVQICLIFSEQFPMSLMTPSQ